MDNIYILSDTSISERISARLKEIRLISVRRNRNGRCGPCKNVRQEAQEMFRRVVFNVVVRNQDDHTKNISFLMDPEGAWTSAHQMLVPALEITSRQ